MVVVVIFTAVPTARSTTVLQYPSCRPEQGEQALLNGRRRFIASLSLSLFSLSLLLSSTVAGYAFPWPLCISLLLRIIY